MRSIAVVLLQSERGAEDSVLLTAGVLPIVGFRDLGQNVRADSARQFRDAARLGRAGQGRIRDLYDHIALRGIGVQLYPRLFAFERGFGRIIQQISERADHMYVAHLGYARHVHLHLDIHALRLQLLRAGIQERVRDRVAALAERRLELGLFVKLLGVGRRLLGAAVLQEKIYLVLIS